MRKYTIKFDVDVEAENTPDALWKAREEIGKGRGGEDITWEEINAPRPS